MINMKAIAALVLVAMVALFTVQNAITVDVKFLFFSLPVPRAVLAVVLLAAGFMLSVSLSSFSKLKGN